jgi:two-component system nitrogen regulation sensor histidine kinase GlnL
LFPRRVRPWHLIVIPAATMGLLLLLFRAMDILAADLPGLVQSDPYKIGRPVVISLGMVSVIAWLVIRHRRQYEAQLQKRSDDLEATRDFLASVIETSGEAIITLDARGRITSWNRAAEQIYGWNAGEMRGQTFERLLAHGPDAELDKQRIAESLREGRTFRHYETTRVHKDGHRITVHVTHTPLIDSTGQVTGCTVTSHDVTEVRELSARLREQERLAALGELAAAVAHEVKNPLAGIRGACDILARGYGKGDRRYELGQEVLRQVDRLNQTVRDLLLFARPKASRPVPTDIHQVLEHVLKLMGEDPQSDKVQVGRRYDPELPTLRVDPQQMEQVFFNVFVNACQAMEFQGDLTVTTERNGRYARIGIRDTGPGLPKEGADKIFEPFFTSRAKGSGLGLAIVRNIVGAHEGSVVANNLPRGGAEIVISLPLQA